MKYSSQKFIFLILLLSISNMVVAAIQHGATVTLTGMEGNGTQVYVGITPNTHRCLYGGVYFTEPAELDKALSIALAAKLAEKTVRVDFTQATSGGQCLGTGIYVE